MECNHFNGCSALICPRDNDSMDSGIWFSDEDICISKQPELFIKNQKKIKRKTTDAGCFTHDMLNRNITIRTGISGIDPEKDIHSESAKWIVKHPGKRELPENRKVELRARMQRMRAGSSHKLPVYSDKNGLRTGAVVVSLSR